MFLGKVVFLSPLFLSWDLLGCLYFLRTKERWLCPLILYFGIFVFCWYWWVWYISRAEFRKFIWVLELAYMSAICCTLLALIFSLASNTFFYILSSVLHFFLTCFFYWSLTSRVIPKYSAVFEYGIIVLFITIGVQCFSFLFVKFICTGLFLFSFIFYFFVQL